MRRLLPAAVLAGLCLALAGVAHADSGVLLGLPIGSATAMVNGSPATLDSPAVIESGRTLVPLRFISERLGATVGWDGETRRVTIQSAGHVLVLTIGVRQGEFDGAAFSLDVPPTIIHDRTMVPLRLVAQRLGAAVGWEAAARRVWVAVGSPPGFVLAKDNSFVPADITVRPGTRVVFINGDKEEHTVTDFDSNAYDLNLEVGEAVSIVYSQPGPNRYTCLVHDQMDGTVVVAP